MACPDVEPQAQSLDPVFAAAGAPAPVPPGPASPDGPPPDPRHRMPASSSPRPISPGPCAASPTRCSGGPRASARSWSSASRPAGRGLARRLVAVIEEVEGVSVPVGVLDVTMYRDDLRHQPTRHQALLIPATGVGNRSSSSSATSCSGRTVRAALDALADYGRPRAVQLAVPCRPRPPAAADPSRLCRQNLPTSTAEGPGPDSATASTSSASPEGCPDDPPPPALAADLTGRMPRSSPRPPRCTTSSTARSNSPTAGPDRHQPLLRGLHPDPYLVRARREVDERRRSISPPRDPRRPRGVAARHRPDRRRDVGRRLHHPHSASGACHQVARLGRRERHQRR